MYKKLGLALAAALAMGLMTPNVASAAEAQATRADKAIDKALEAVDEAALKGPAASQELAEGVTVGAVTVTADAAQGDTLQVDDRGITQGVDGVTYAVEGDEATTRLTAVMATEADPAAQSYTLDVPAGAKIVHQDDGDLGVVDSDGGVLASVDAPWAVDSAGNELPTRYELEGNTIKQVTNVEGAVFPVVADPRIRGCLQYRRWAPPVPSVCHFFSLKETFDINHAWQSVPAAEAGSLGACSKLKDWRVAAVCAAGGTQWWWWYRNWMQDTANRRMCLTYKISAPVTQLTRRRC